MSSPFPEVALPLSPDRLSEQLNRGCFCITRDTPTLTAALEREVGDAALVAGLVETHPHLFSDVIVFLSSDHLEQMLEVVRAIESVARLPAYRADVLAEASDAARHDTGTVGAFMGYDFHVGAEGPKLIEVNTNAGGAFLNAMLARAQRACCPEIEPVLADLRSDGFESAVTDMFRTEWRAAGHHEPLRRIAIADDAPHAQYLYPEFKLAQRLLARHGVDAVIADAGGFAYEDGRLLYEGEAVDLVYNRVTDFGLDAPEHAALRRAYLCDAAVVTPNPHVHALLADKRNLALLSDRDALRRWNVPEGVAQALVRGIPRTVAVSAHNAEELWKGRSGLFFKPARGHGSRAAYRGDKLTKGKWAEIVRGGYVAQSFAPPGERMIGRDAAAVPLKADIRLYTYAGEILLAAARLYQGQTTNFRTPGGGFAPVFVVG